MKFLKTFFGILFLAMSVAFISIAYTQKGTAPVSLTVATVFALLSFKLLNIKEIFKNVDKTQLEDLKKERDFLQSECARLSAISQSTEDDDTIKVLRDLIEKKNQLDKDCQEQYNELKNLKDEIEHLKNKKTELEQMSLIYSNQINVLEYGLYTPRYKFITSSTYKAKLDEIRNTQATLIKSNYAVTGIENFKIDRNKTQDEQVVKQVSKLMLRAFNGECDASIYNIKYNNFSNIEKRIRKSFEVINKIGSEIHVSITFEYLDLKIQELHLAYEYELKIQEEKEILREQREKDREERALQKEIELKRQKITKEVTHINNAINSLKEKLQNATDEEKENIEKTISELQNSINDYEEQQKELDYRIENVGAGYVYIISNIGAFGENVFKIGVTRRLEPLERISELSSASVPFKFDVHALIFSYKAYELETALHKRFEKNRINLVNNRKEFFKVDINEIEKELEKYKDLTIEFTKQADAEEYRETLSILRANSKTV
ncbi:hypothetical protein HMPREF9628_01558 [Peptoanaerobacter stomatis]|uniref:Bacteriophage T5 Orf172 DNA-binding domain-containing protein n=2 Tax=Peptoanaerobacter stomatis TaxID=796937 RepID=G9XCI1_9FIRM|nr:DUF4041 domain-containing protein [Peptoanaerobacter stomatis]EHL19374.1 hypothetical protein HMPREF9628_01558 [Peptoanaerobacter stomatis]